MRRRRVLILIDDLQRHEALAGVGQRDRDRSGVEVEDGRRIKRVAVHADDRLVVDRRELAMVLKFSEPAFLQSDHTEIEIGLGTDEVIDGDRNGACRGWRRRLRLHRGDCQQAQRLTRIVVVLSLHDLLLHLFHLFDVR